MDNRQWKCCECGYEMSFAMFRLLFGNPSPGDVADCTRCYAIHVFDDDLELRVATADERASFSAVLNKQIELCQKVNEEVNVKRAAENN